MDYKNYHRDKTYKEEENHFKNIFLTRFLVANRFLKNKKEKRILDIGTSTGTMLDIFKEHGFETWGVEPSASANIAKNKKHKIIKNYFEKAKIPSNYFDVVIANHTLEHMKNPEKVLEKIHKILKTKGLLLIDVPNAGGLASRILGSKWPYRLPEEHISQFTKESLSKIFNKTGFRIIHFKSRSGIFELSNPISEIWDALIHGKKRFFTEIINIPYDILVTVLNMGDSMSMVGIKK